MVDNVRTPSFPKAFEFAARQLMAANINTAAPGIIDTYDADTKRARVRLAVKQGFKDGRASMEKALLVDVPVVQPATGELMVHQPIDKDDIVVVIFSKDGLEDFKRKWGLAEPKAGALFADAIAIPWGVHNIAPVDNDAFCIQSADGRTYFKLKDGMIEMRVGGRLFRMTEVEGRLT